MSFASDAVLWELLGHLSSESVPVQNSKYPMYHVIGLAMQIFQSIIDTKRANPGTGRSLNDPGSWYAVCMNRSYSVQKTPHMYVSGRIIVIVTEDGASDVTRGDNLNRTFTRD